MTNLKSSSKVSDVHSTLSAKSDISIRNETNVENTELASEAKPEGQPEQFGSTLEFFFSVLGYAGMKSFINLKKLESFLISKNFLSWCWKRVEISLSCV